jgi:hypothetical protein
MTSRSLILFLAADPASTSPLALAQECSAIEHELKLTPGRDDFELRSKWAVTVDELVRHLLELQPAIVHFSGHGNPAGLLLVGDDGRPHPVAPAALTRLIETAAGSARLAVLNACYSDAQAEALRDAVGCAIGMNGTITDDAARAFAVGFYRALGHRRPVRNAYDQAVATLAAKGLGAQAAPRCLARPELDAGALVLGRGVPQSHAARPPHRPAPAASAPPPPVRHDLFLAYPPADRPSARALYDLLQPDVRVFLDERSLRPDERRDQQLPAAQRASRATVVLISSHADPAWYRGDEIATAVALHRAGPASHLLVPVLLEPHASVPHGLAHVRAVSAAAEGSLAGVAARLREVVARARGRIASPPSTRDVSSEVGPAAASPAAASPAAASPAPLDDGGDHVRLHERLSRLTDAAFEELLLYAKIERRLIAPRTAPLAERILDVAHLSAVDPDRCRRIATLLDERAPWTR